jgi:hypothetical protein
MAELTYVDAVQKLEAGDSFTLQDMKNLSYADLDWHSPDSVDS